MGRFASRLARRRRVVATWGHERTGHEVVARVDGASLRFRCAEAPLEPSGTALASLLDLPAHFAGRRLDVEASVSTAWLARRPDRIDRVVRWWGHTPQLIRPSHGRPDPPRPHRPTALFFSGGVDSFFTLLRHPDPIDALVYVHGFDVDIEDRRRTAAFERVLAEIARATGTRALVVRTDARRHPLFARASFERVHGGLLAAVGHLLGASFERFLVSGSFARRSPVPWGTRWDLDPTWSSETVRFEHFGDAYWRKEKLDRIGHEPLLLQHLRVCWEHRNENLNCGVCEKCVRNRINLHRIGVLERCSAFHGAPDLFDSIDGLARVPAYGWNVYRSFLDDEVGDAVKRAIERLLTRSGDVTGRPATPVGRLGGRGWDAPTVRARIEDAGTRTRYAAASPSGPELDVYARVLEGLAPPARVLVLGMTPELRRLALERGHTVIAVDRSAASIDAYRDWMPRSMRRRESVVERDWSELDTVVTQPVDVVLGDGVFANLPDVRAQEDLLAQIAAVSAGGRLVLRKALLPRGLDPAEVAAPRLVEAYRAGRLDDAEFSLGLRVYGYLAEAYDGTTATLDGMRVYDAVERDRRAGRLTGEEFALAQRCVFRGRNTLPGQDAWEALLRRSGWHFECRVVGPKLWHGFYPMYVCRRGRC